MGSSAAAVIQDSFEVPKGYFSFSDLQGRILEEVEDNRIRVRNEKSSIDLYIHCAGIPKYVYLSTEHGEKDEVVQDISDPNPKMNNPLKGVVNKRIGYVNPKYSSFEHKHAGLPRKVEIYFKDTEEHYEIVGQDGIIFIERVLTD